MVYGDYSEYSEGNKASGVIGFSFRVYCMLIDNQLLF